MSNFNESFYNLGRFHQKQLLKIEADRCRRNMNQEDYIKTILEEFDITIINSNKKQNHKDDGIDFIMMYNNQIYICQVKYWKKPLCKKEIKEIYGAMYLSEFAIRCRNDKKVLKYLLICPFISMRCNELEEMYSKENYYLVANAKFIDLLTNPQYFMENNLYERNVIYNV